MVQVLRAARESAGLSQAELAKRLSKPPSYVAKVELKERRVDVVEFIEFLRAAGADESAAFIAVAAAIS
ncbi:helix-turn-helix transcriptional regulator [Phenylobacterium sp.]|uniref:helix-turn-helix domain-containing protein n=1 Tax=Phenylobacterium sp. TaxID=1871053 RepID=UPI0025E7C3F4|nr:helix-turn-helix transcriptional regulator [Phenylobacterium sp.]